MGATSAAIFVMSSKLAFEAIVCLSIFFGDDFYDTLTRFRGGAGCVLWCAGLTWIPAGSVL